MLGLTLKTHEKYLLLRLELVDVHQTQVMGYLGYNSIEIQGSPVLIPPVANK